MSEHERPDVGRRDLGALLGILGGAMGLKALTGCSSESGAPPLGEATGSVGEAVSGTAISWVTSVLGTQRNGDLATRGGQGWTAPDGGAPPINARVVIAEGSVTPGDGGGGVFYWNPGGALDAGAGAVDDGGTFIVPNGAPGSVGAGWQRIFDGYLDVRWFGARGDAIADDSAAIQAAIQSAMRRGGGTVFLPAGTYSLKTPQGGSQSQLLLIPDGATNISFLGEGPASVLRIATNADPGVILLGTHFGAALTSPVSNIAVSRLTFDGNPSRAADLCPLLVFCGGSPGVAGETGGATSNISVTDCTFRNSSGNNVVRFGDFVVGSLLSSGVTDVIFSNNFIDNCPLVGATDHSSLFACCDGAVISGNHFRNSGGAAPGDASALSLSAAAMELKGTSLVVSGNHFDGLATAMVFGSGCDTRNIVVDGNVAVGGVLAQVWSGPRPFTTQSIKITNNVAAVSSGGASGVFGIVVQSSSASSGPIDHLEIIGNTFRLDAAAPESIGLDISASASTGLTNLLVAGNSFQGAWTNAIQVSQVTTMTVSGICISGNAFSLGPGGTGIAFTGAGLVANVNLTNNTFLSATPLSVSGVTLSGVASFAGPSSPTLLGVPDGALYQVTAPAAGALYVYSAGVWGKVVTA